jgi:hypothetical protein
LGIWDMIDRRPFVFGDQHHVVFNLVVLGIFVSGVIGSGILARRNLRLGRGDRRGAAKVSRAMFWLVMAHWAFSNEHVIHLWELMLAAMAVGRGFIAGALTRMCYLALEPSVRRRWPRMLIGWSRVLSGDLRDPVLGREVLGGAALIAAGAVFVYAAPLVSAWLSDTSVRPFPRGSSILPLADPTRGFVQFILESTVLLFLFDLLIVALLLLVRMAVKKDWIAAAIIVVLLSIPALGQPHNLIVAMLASLIGMGTLVLALFRFGLTAFILGTLMQTLAENVPLARNFSMWYAPTEFVGLLLLLSVGVCAFLVSLGGRPAFGGVTVAD